MFRPRTGSEVLRALADLGEFSYSCYPGVIYGRISNDDRRRRVMEFGSSELPALKAILRLSAMDHVVAYEFNNVTETVCEALEPFIEKFLGKNFFVRARLRGMKGRLESRVVERAVGAFIFDRCEEVGYPSRVDFDDADIVLVIEVVENTVGFGFLDREMAALPILKPR